MTYPTSEAGIARPNYAADYAGHRVINKAHDVLSASRAQGLQGLVGN
jgi:hypothetical protein